MHLKKYRGMRDNSDEEGALSLRDGWNQKKGGGFRTTDGLNKPRKKKRSANEKAERGPPIKKQEDGLKPRGKKKTSKRERLGHRQISS